MKRSDLREADKLPALQIADAVNEALAHHERLVITAPPGAGKSTLLPLTMLEAFGSEGKILMLEPRRLAARQIAERTAYMLGENVGQTVGYRVRFESKVSAQTRLEVLTEGILTRMLVQDPTLDGVSVVIFDEFHERSLASDVALALVREAQQVIRPDLKIVLMSATIDATNLCQTLDAPLVESEGKMFPIETRYAPIETQSLQSLCEGVCHTVREAHRIEEGDILVFLPGELEIRQCASMLDGALGQTHICPLYGMLPPREQQLAIAPSLPGQRKVVLATPIAETSLTIEGVRVVIDAGLCRKMVFNPQSGLSHLQTVQISKDMANQRRGRAGRVAPGVCYRLWSLATEHRMEECRQPEILEADLSPTLLDVAAWGEAHPERLPWLTPPPTGAIAQGQQLLRLLGAMDEQGRITQHGQRLSALPCHPRIAQMLLSAQDASQQALAADIAALLEEKDPLASRPDCDTDINTRILALREARARCNMNRPWDRIARIAEQYRRIIQRSLSPRSSGSEQAQPPSGPERSLSPRPSGSAAGINTPQPATTTGRLLAQAYPERIAQSLSSTRYRMATGDELTIDHNDELSAHDWIVATYVNGSRLFLGAPVDVEELADLYRERETIAWDSKHGQLLARRDWRIGCLLVRSKPLSISTDGDGQQLRQQLLQTLCEAIHKEGTAMLDFDDTVGNLQRRVAAVASWHPELELPDLSTDAILAQSEAWLPMYLEGRKLPTTLAELKKIDLPAALWSMLDYQQQAQVDRLAPTHIAVPTGSRIRVEYRQGAELPILRVRLQECFGLTDTPRVDDGHRPVLMELLSPGFKPVQLTQDLRSFWQGTYFEVRKELKRRYPKHAWPDNPLEAEAVRGVRRDK